MAERIKSLYSLIHMHSNTPYIIITTPTAVIQKVLPRNIISQVIFKITVQQHLSTHHIEDYLTAHGYIKYSTVQDVGEFSINNNIIDIFPMTHLNPIKFI